MTSIPESDRVASFVGLRLGQHLLLQCERHQSWCHLPLLELASDDLYVSAIVVTVLAAVCMASSTTSLWFTSASPKETQYL